MADLKAAIANWGNRSDLTARIPEFVTLAQTRITYGSMEAPFISDPVRIRAMEQSSYTTISGRSVQLPTGFLQARRFYLSGDCGGEIEFVSPDAYWETYNGSGTGTPRKFTVEGENFLFGPSPDGSYTAQLLYYKAFASLSADSDTNWLLTNAPAVYLQAALIELYKYVRDYPKATDALKAFSGAVNALITSDKHDRFSSPWVGRVDGPTP